MLKRKIETFLQEKINHHLVLLTPKNTDFGDFSINMHQLGLTNTTSIIKNLKSPFFEKIEEKAGFINFFISKKLLMEELEKIIQEKDRSGENKLLTHQKIMLEFAHPNTHKLFHIGHLRNIILGDALARIFTIAGASVVRANYQGDVGLHIAKCLWKIKNKKLVPNEDEGLNIKNKKTATLEEKVQLLGAAYVEGNRAYESDEQAKKEIQEINRQIFTTDPMIMPLWKKTRTWSLEYFDNIYTRLGVGFDRLYFESEVADMGKKIALQALEKGILKKSEGALIFDGERHDVDTRVFINSFGLPTYEGKELGLAHMEFTEFGTLDRCIHVVAAEQTSFFKTVFKVEELLDETLYKDKQHHLVYGMVRLKKGKMSSREGTIIEGPTLIDEIKEKIKKVFSCTTEIAEQLSIASVKYAFLKTDAQKDIVFDIDESISLHGNSGPYILYAFTRCQSVLKKNIGHLKETNVNRVVLHREENLLLRALVRFPEIVESAVAHSSPHILCTYIYDLAQSFNLFYEKHPILKAQENERMHRLRLTYATSIILSNTLSLIGIDTIEKL